MNKIFIFGIDGLDRDYLLTHKNELPNFSSLLDISGDITLKSVHPPDSHTAWATIYTGLNPAQHGIVDFVDPLDKSRLLSSSEVDNSAIRGKTFWDYAGSKGRKVCIILPHIGFPPWKVNGLMVARSAIDMSIKIYPEIFESKYNLASLTCMSGFPDRKELFKFIDKARTVIENEKNFTLELIQEHEFDLIFTYSSSLDWIQHYLLSYSMDAGSEYKDVVLNMYKEYDDILGTYLNNFNHEKIIFMVLSDHGHGLRPLKVINLNEVLRLNGFLKSNIHKKDYSDPLYAFDMAKKQLIKFIVKYHLGNVAKKLLATMPSARKLYTAPASINWSETIAYISDLSGIKAYSYGGVRILKENLNGSDYEQVRNDIIDIFSKIKDPSSGRKIFKWIVKREHLYKGRYINKYPDLVFDLNEDYGAGWNVYDELIAEAPISNLVPGSHRIDSAVFLSSKGISKDNLVLADIYELILNYIDE